MSLSLEIDQFSDGLGWVSWWGLRVEIPVDCPVWGATICNGS